MKKLSIALTLLIVAGGCTDREEARMSDNEAEAPENQMMTDTLPSAAEVGDTTGALTVLLEEWTVRAARDSVGAGARTFRVRNNGSFGHILRIEGQGEEWMTDTIPPGEWVALETELEPGDYILYCPIVGEQDSHRDLGMDALLSVREEEGGAGTR